GEASILKVLSQGLQVLFDIHSVLFFLYDRERDVLVGKGITGDKENNLSNHVEIPYQKEKSLLARSLYQETALDSFSDSTKAAPTIMDKQLIRFLGKDGMLCLPMIAHRTHVGVIVIGIDEHHFSHLRDRVKLLTMFASQAALGLAADHLRQDEINRLRGILKKIQGVLDKG
ncbi:MAG: GAF domain-containing protein, partial [Deltaproteobacteria bacterium]|nr:GAF domain-containing protein [Deltaproteobacteria bacterium]MBW2019061.1 GAF domain-containing protein [Deltaproteobacteria bacterium]MBW2073548.1 GAF domain-containing protein [Deltaproteobacteria bacterium]